MTEMVDRIMRAMNAYKDTLPKTSDDAPFIYSHRKGLARAAIAAMREPTEAMVKKGGSEVDWLRGLTDAWKAMIDAALSE
jgi:hypothetical protein